MTTESDARAELLGRIKVQIIGRRTGFMAELAAAEQEKLVSAWWARVEKKLNEHDYAALVEFLGEMEKKIAELESLGTGSDREARLQASVDRLEAAARQQHHLGIGK